MEKSAKISERGNSSGIIMLLLLLTIAFTASSQTLEEFYRNSTRTNHTAMYMLGTWAAGNMIIGGIGMGRTSGTTHYFHQMNLMWNTVNMGIAAFGLFSGAPEFSSSVETILANHRKMENLYLINSGLDLIYIAAGGFMIHLSKSSVKRADMLEGYGKSVILQGGFLLVFDTTFWLLQRNLRLNLPDNISLNVLHEYPGIQLTMWF